MEKNGFEIVAGVVGERGQRELIASLASLEGAGRRGLLDTPSVAKLAASSRLLDLVRPHLNSEPRPVRAIYFDKTPKTNWMVAWHQDLTIAVRKRVDVPGFGPWSMKGGVPHVQPPVELLEQMLTIRLHLDACDEANGALRVIPGSHFLGRLSAEQIRNLRGQRSEFVCRLSAGDALLMSPLLLHASSRSQKPGHRRVLHIEYAAFTLPAGLQWSEAA